jgi:F0F1-type ATP synthase delta subunit
VDPSIIGGIITRIGSVVYDGSLTAQLTKMRDRLERQS